MRNHNFTTCGICGKEYVCGDCITNNCELGHNKLKCEHYQAHIRQERSSAVRMLEMARNVGATKEQRGVARLLGGMAWDNVCKDLTGAELADALKHKVWANMELGTEEIALMEQAIDRLTQVEKERDAALSLSNINVEAELHKRTKERDEARSALCREQEKPKLEDEKQVRENIAYLVTVCNKKTEVLRAVRHSMDTDKPFPSIDKLTEAINL